MEPDRRGRPLRAWGAVIALLVGLAALGVWRVAAGSQNLPYDRGATPPTSVLVTRDATYSLAVPGGVNAMLAHGVPTRVASGQEVVDLQCTWSSDAATGTSGLPLDVTPEGKGTKAENTVGHFAAPVSGRIHVDCAGWGAMFVPDSNDRAYDWSGLALLVSVIGLTIGSALGLSELRVAVQRSRRTREQDDADATADEPADEPAEEPADA